MKYIYFVTLLRLFTLKCTCNEVNFWGINFTCNSTLWITFLRFTSIFCFTKVYFAEHLQFFPSLQLSMNSD